MKKIDIEQFWIITGIILAVIIATIIISEWITPFLNYLIWGIEYQRPR